jgi:hypothetical protein
MADDINIEITEETIEVEISDGATWDGVSGKPTPAAENSFMVANAALAWVVKTLAQVKTILALTFADIAADPFQTPAFANPLNLDATSHKDFKPGTITGNTTVNLNNAGNGNGGLIELIMDGTGGYTVPLGTMFVTKIGTNSIDTAASKKNYVFWFCDNASGELTYTIQTV